VPHHLREPQGSTCSCTLTCQPMCKPQQSDPCSHGQLHDVKPPATSAHNHAAAAARTGVAAPHHQQCMSQGTSRPLCHSTLGNPRREPMLVVSTAFSAPHAD
jgi:hypothetical protein